MEKHDLHKTLYYFSFPCFNSMLILVVLSLYPNKMLLAQGISKEKLPRIDSLGILQHKNSKFFYINYYIANARPKQKLDVQLCVILPNKQKVYPTPKDASGHLGRVMAGDGKKTIRWESSYNFEGDITANINLYLVPKFNIFCPDCPPKYFKKKYDIPILTISTACLLSASLISLYQSQKLAHEYYSNTSLSPNEKKNLLNKYNDQKKITTALSLSTASLFTINLTTHWLLWRKDFKPKKYPRITQ